MIDYLYISKFGIVDPSEISRTSFKPFLITSRNSLLLVESDCPVKASGCSFHQIRFIEAPRKFHSSKATVAFL